ncbi:hypothetical protein E4U15_008284, partial [Claviceps sp. LM218 group G6]
SMIVIKGFLIHCERERTLEPWDYESDRESSMGAAMEEIWNSGEVAPVQVAGVGDAHATDRDDGLAEGGIHDADGEFEKLHERATIFANFCKSNLSAYFGRASHFRLPFRLERYANFLNGIVDSNPTWQTQ